MPKRQAKRKSIRLKVGDWAVATYVGRCVCLTGPAQVIGDRVQILDRRFRYCYVEDQNIVFYGDKASARYVFDRLDDLDRVHAQEQADVSCRHVTEIRGILHALSNELKRKNSKCRAELGLAQIYACLAWPHLAWTSLDSYSAPADEYDDLDWR